MMNLAALIDFVPRVQCILPCPGYARPALHCYSPTDEHFITLTEDGLAENGRVDWDRLTKTAVVGDPEVYASYTWVGGVPVRTSTNKPAGRWTLDGHTHKGLHRVLFPDDIGDETREPTAQVVGVRSFLSSWTTLHSVTGVCQVCMSSV